MQSVTKFLQVAKARHSYRLRPGLASSGKQHPLPQFTTSIWAMPGIEPRISCNCLEIPGSLAWLAPRNDRSGSGPRPLVADGQEFHRPVRHHDPEGGANGALDQVDVAAMGAHQFGGDGQA
jgi:hypothetical protein